jgi:C1A family cysteine protease
MNFFTIFLLIAFTQAHQKLTFEEWEAIYRKNFNDFQRVLYRRIFLSNFFEIETHNADSSSSYVKSLNEFSHFRAKEFIATRCRTKVPMVNEVLDRAATTTKKSISTTKTSRPQTTTISAVQTTTQKAPLSLDYSNFLQPVQYQGNCGACWAFATMSHIEGRLKRKNASFNSVLSPQYSIDCDTDDSGCNNGWPIFAMRECLQ